MRTYHEKIQAKNEGRPAWVLHDGPPYANGQIHVGHALNKITKDFIVRHKSMTGYRSPYIPGWDTHGLPIESALIKRDGVNRKEMSLAAFRDLCKEYALEQVDGQRTDFKRLGVTGEWDNPYLTLAPEYEAQQIRIFGQMADKGYIYKGAKPVYWSPSSESSLAEAEVEYADVTSPSIYVAFKMRDTKGVIDEDAELVIWTTTPWTLPANMGIALLADANYVQVAVDNRRFVVAEDLLTSVANAIGWEDVQIEKVFKGASLELAVAAHPFYDRDSLVMVGDHVTLDSGTGLVHTAPGHGEDDYFIGKKYGLKVLSPVNGQGHFTDEAPGLEGMFYAKGQRYVLEWITESGALLKQDQIVHSYPHDWRTKKPVIYRATPQWFASIDKFRDELLTNVMENVTWYHPSGERRMYNMIRDRGDWVISRQRVWGVPLPIFYAENGEPILDIELINHVADLVQEYGSNIWFEKEAKDLLPEGYTHPNSPNGEFSKEMDIMDVWFDSGTSYAGVLQVREDQVFPADMYLEGSDQYRGWFNSSFTTSVAVNGYPPYKSVLSQGFVMDGKGQKMSKSIGNVITPEEVTGQLGADIIRLWVSSVDYENDVRISQDILKQVSETYRKIRNTIRFMLSNIGDFDPAVNTIAYEDLRNVDKYMLAKFRVLNAQILDCYNNYDYATLHKLVINFITTDLSAFYLDFAKDVVYIEAPDNQARRAMQTVIYEVLHKLIRLLTPILVHTMEEAWKELPGVWEEFVQLTDMPVVENMPAEQLIVDEWAPFFEMQEGVHKALEEAKNWQEDPIKKSFEAHVTVYADQAFINKLNALSDDLAQLLIVSKLDLLPLEDADAEALDFEAYKVTVSRAEGHICERCRAVRPEVGTIEKAPNMCQRCFDIVEEHYPEYFTQADGE